MNDKPWADAVGPVHTFETFKNKLNCVNDEALMRLIKNNHVLAIPINDTYAFPAAQVPIVLRTAPFWKLTELLSSVPEETYSRLELAVWMNTPHPDLHGQTMWQTLSDMDMFAFKWPLDAAFQAALADLRFAVDAGRYEHENAVESAHDVLWANEDIILVALDGLVADGFRHSTSVEAFVKVCDDNWETLSLPAKMLIKIYVRRALPVLEDQAAWPTVTQSEQDDALASLLILEPFIERRSSPPPPPERKVLGVDRVGNRIYAPA